MSSPPRVDFPTSDLDDVDMDGPPQEGSAEQQSMSIVPQKLFLEGTPSAAGTPARQRYAASAAASSPLAGVAARRAVGMSTPRRPPRTPLFARTSYYSLVIGVLQQTIQPGALLLWLFPALHLRKLLAEKLPSHLICQLAIHRNLSPSHREWYSCLPFINAGSQ